MACRSPVTASAPTIADAWPSRPSAALPPATRSAPIVYLQVGPFGCPGGERCPTTLAARPEGDVTIEFAGVPAAGFHVRAAAGGPLEIEPQEIFGIVLDPTTPTAALSGAQPFTLGHCGLWSGIDLGGSWWDPVGPIDWDHPDTINSAEGTVAFNDPDHATFTSRVDSPSSWSGATAASTSRSATDGQAGRRLPTGAGYPASMVRPLSRKLPLAELHCHLGGAVTPAIMWGIAHAQGIKLPTKDYWEFRDMITVSPRRNRSFDGYLQLFHWTELIQSSPLAVERSVYEVVGGAYRKNNVTTMELRFNPMKRNRGGEQDLDHIIAAAVRGMDKATLEYPVKPGLIFCLDRAFPFELNEIIVEKAIAWRDRGVVGVDIAGPESATFRVADYRRLFRRARQFGLGLTVHTGESGPVDEVARVVELLEPDRIGHGVKAAYDPRAMAMIRDRGIVLEICPTSNLNTRVVSGWDEFRWIFDTFRRNEVRFTINTDGPEMLKTYIRDEMAQLGRLGILSVEDQETGRRDVARGLVRAERLGRARAAARTRPSHGRRARGGLGDADQVAAHATDHRRRRAGRRRGRLPCPDRPGDPERLRVPDGARRQRANAARNSRRGLRRPRDRRRVPGPAGPRRSRRPSGRRRLRRVVRGRGLGAVARRTAGRRRDRLDGPAAARPRLVRDPRPVADARAAGAQSPARSSMR